eukprot:1855417-Amphidinium_carterae.2
MVPHYRFMPTNVFYAMERVARGTLTFQLPCVCLRGSIALPAQSALVEPTLPKTIENLLAEEGAFRRQPIPDKISRSFLNVECWPSIASEVSRRLGVLRPPDLCLSINDKRITAGLFGVPKKGAEKARLIVDKSKHGRMSRLSVEMNSCS